MEGSIRLVDDPGASFSFQFGDACRYAIGRPWLLPILPIIIGKRFVNHRKLKSKSVTNLVRHLILIDSEVLDEEDLEELGTFLSELDKDVVVNIGSNRDFQSTVSLLSRVNSGLSSEEWNAYLEDMLTSLIRTQRPSSFIFIGKYPYAGITGMLRRVGKSSRTLWIPVRATEEALKNRGVRFSSVSPPETWFQLVNSSSISLSGIHIHSDLIDEYNSVFGDAGIEFSEAAESCAIQLMPSNRLTNIWPLLEGKIVITVGEGTDFIANLPESLRSNNLHLNSATPIQILHIVERITNSINSNLNFTNRSDWRKKILFQSVVDLFLQEI